MHVSGCKTWHTHGAAGRKVAGKSSGTRRNPPATGTKTYGRLKLQTKATAAKLDLAIRKWIAIEEKYGTNSPEYRRQAAIVNRLEKKENERYVAEDYAKHGRYR